MRHLPLLFRFWAFLAIASFATSSLPGQTETGIVRGYITDGSGASAPGAAIRLQNLAGSYRRESISGNQGEYEFSFVAPGRYEVRVTAPGFRESVLPEVVLQVNQVLRLDVMLELGAITEQVTVTAETSLLQSETTVVGAQLDERQIVDLPGRSLLSLMGAAPGVTQLNIGGFVSNGLSSVQPSRGGVGANFNFGGYRQTGNYYILDGVSNTNWNINSLILFPQPESLQELRVQTSTNTAPFGLVPGGTVNTVTRSGSNKFHGTFYDYLRNNALDARPYAINNTGGINKPPLRQNQFGFTVGGPLALPGKSSSAKTFFFAGYQGLITRDASQASSTIPTTASRRGDLSAYNIPIYNPDSLSNGIRTPYANSIIPESRIDLVSQRWLAYMPQPTLSGTRNNFINNRPGKNDAFQVNTRLDRQFGSNNFLYGTFHVTDEEFNRDSNFGDITGVTTDVRAMVASLAYTHIVNSMMVNNFKVGFNRLRAVDGVYSEGQRDIVSELGIQGLNSDPINWGFPNLGTGFISIVNDGANRPTNQRDNVYQIIDDMTLITGRHSLTFGGEFRRMEMNFRQTNPARGIFRYTGNYTRGPDPANPTQGTGLEYADFLLGHPLQATRIVGTPQAYLRSNYMGLYIGDTIRLSRRFSLIAGLRYDYFDPPTEQRDNYFNLDFSSLPQQPELVRIGESSSLPDRLIQANKTNFAPRLGIAFQLDPKTVIRTAYGLYNIQEIGAVFYNLVRNGVRTEINNASPISPELTTANAFGGSQPTTPSYYWIDPNSSTPYVQQWNFSIQRALPGDIAVEATYTGAKGTHLYRYRSLNTPFRVLTGDAPRLEPGPIAQRRPFADLGPISGFETSASSYYHALQLRLEKSFSSGLSFINSFTWGKSIDDSDIPISDVYQNPGAQNERDLSAERGLSFFDIRRRFVSSVIWETPFGKGQHFLNRGVLGQIAGPWQISTMLVLQDGYQQNFYNFGSSSVIGTTQRPNVVAGQNLVLTKEEREALPLDKFPRRELQWYNPYALTTPGTYELGNAGRNIGPTPGSATLNMALFRRFVMPWGDDQHRLEFRTDMLNALNRVNWGIPLPSPWTPSLHGQVLGAGSMRTITMSLKYQY